MGLKIWNLLPKKEIEIKELKGKVLAIDSSPMLYQFLTSIRQPDGTPLQDSKGNITSHLQGISSRVSNLLSQNLKLIFCFDGKPPILKVKTQEEREYRKRIAEKKLKQAMEKEDIQEMLKFSKQTTRLNKQILEESKELLKAFGLPVIQCPGEAEAQAAFIAEKGDAYGVVSQDADALLYSTPYLIRNLTISQRKRLPSGATIKNLPEIISLKETLKILKINHDQLIILSILVGTDYNEGIYRIGPKTALKLVREYKNFDELFEKVNASFNWKQIYAVFKSMPIMKNYQLKFREPDIEKIKEILVEQHDFSEERVSKMLEKITKREKNQRGLTEF